MMFVKYLRALSPISLSLSSSGPFTLVRRLTALTFEKLK